MTLVIGAVVALVVVAAAAVLAGTSEGAQTPGDDQYVEIADVAQTITPKVTENGSSGQYTIRCGSNAERHLNADNPVMSPGTPAGAHHTHEYVGNSSADYTSTDDSLEKAKSTCDKDLSSYFWPVLRLTDGVGHDAHAPGGGEHGNTGEVVPPKSVTITYVGNPASKVLPMPRFLRMITGDPMALTHQYGDRVRAKWSCSGHQDRYTTKYPLCENGESVVRSYEFASCWDGGNIDSASHRTHIVHPSAAGICPARTFPVPQLRLTVTYDVPKGRPFAIDSFPEQHRDPASDHAMYINVMPAAMMNELVRCINEGRSCSSAR
ncbi:hypothetical protein Lesp02_68420 [Lentzea sp. NBRC 105346]|nr:hypothetical protein Lesp02_68420 [Lentzea sp. NBRC 105346]